jgi:hypothetical protein
MFLFSKKLSYLVLKNMVRSGCRGSYTDRPITGESSASSGGASRGVGASTCTGKKGSLFTGGGGSITAPGRTWGLIRMPVRAGSGSTSFPVRVRPECDSSVTGV